MPKPFNHTGHKELWGWLTENPDKQKSDWPGWEENGGTYAALTDDCFACEYDDYFCMKCPLVWENGHCNMGGGIFGKWFRSDNMSERAALAAQIRDLPVRDGVTCI